MRDARSNAPQKFKAWAERGTTEPADSEQETAAKMIQLAIEDYLLPPSPEHKVHAEQWIFDETSTDRDWNSFPWHCKKAGVNRTHITATLKDEKIAGRIMAALTLTKDLQQMQDNGTVDDRLRRRTERAILSARAGLAEVIHGK
jgi:hypothetical protein